MSEHVTLGLRWLMHVDSMTSPHPVVSGSPDFSRRSVSGHRAVTGWSRTKLSPGESPLEQEQARPLCASECKTWPRGVSRRTAAPAQRLCPQRCLWSGRGLPALPS